MIGRGAVGKRSHTSLDSNGRCGFVRFDQRLSLSVVSKTSGHRNRMVHDVTYLQAGLIDEMHLAIAPVLLGAGEPLLAGLDAARLGHRCAEHAATAGAMHVVLTREAR